MDTPETNIALDTFDRIQNEFPQLEMTIDTNLKWVDAELNIPKQGGLVLDVSLNLQHDELHLNAGELWASYFPVKDTEVVEMFFEAVTGILSGSYRILQLHRKGKTYKVLLQKPSGDYWETVFTDNKKLTLPWLTLQEVEIKNTLHNNR